MGIIYIKKNSNSKHQYSYSLADKNCVSKIYMPTAGQDMTGSAFALCFSSSLSLSPSLAECVGVKATKQNILILFIHKKIHKRIKDKQLYESTYIHMYENLT